MRIALAGGRDPGHGASSRTPRSKTMQIRLSALLVCLATAVTGLAGAAIGIPSFRLEGAYLALATLGLAESVRIFISATDYVGASIGLGDIPPPFIGSMPRNHAFNSGWRNSGVGWLFNDGGSILSDDKEPFEAA